MADGFFRNYRIFFGLAGLVKEPFSSIEENWHPEYEITMSGNTKTWKLNLFTLRTVVPVQKLTNQQITEEFNSNDNEKQEEEQEEEKEQMEQVEVTV